MDAAHVEIPYDVSETRIPGVLDLRYPDARKWLCDEFGFGKAGVLVLPNGAPTREITFLDMLPSLMARDNGGDDLTNVIGAYLRLIGVSALVFPSARSNVFVDFRDGTLNDFGGWNLVDYRDAETEPRATMILWDVEWPWFRDSSKMRHLDRTTVIRAPEDDSMWRGSFRVEGNTEHHLLFLHVQLCLRLWGAGHPESVPWYRWHVTRPSSASEPFPLEATCQDCGHVLAPVEDVFAFHMLPRQCPGCGFAKIHVG